MHNDNLKVIVKKVVVSTKEELTIKLLADEVEPNLRRTNQEIFDEIVSAFGSASMNAIRWYSSKLMTDTKYRLKYGIDDAKCYLRARRIKK